MDTFYLSIAYITAGIALVSGVINILAGLYSRTNKADLYFGIICLCGFFFLVLPPGGFIVSDKPPYPLSILIKRIFIWMYYILLPVFIERYTGYRNRVFVWGTAIVMGSSYLLMAASPVDRTVWYWLSRLGMAIILWYGIVAALYQKSKGGKKEAIWLLAAMTVYGILLLLSLFNEAYGIYLGSLLKLQVFFPLHLNLIAFIVIISIRLRFNTHEKYQLEKALRWRETRWNLVVQNMHLLIIELDTNGQLHYVNPYATKKLGAHKEEQLLGKPWFETFALPAEAASLKKIFLDSIHENKILNNFTSRLLVQENQLLTVNWTNVLVYNSDDTVRGIMSIGMDNTEQEKVLEQVKQLKDELERETIGMDENLSENLAEELGTDLVGKSETLMYALQKSKLVANTNASVLLLGETGSGKEMFAGLIHKHSYRSEKPFVKVNCAALPSELIESELFGHEKGAFTGAVGLRKGKFELANGGSIFLDEIGELPLSLQSKLLRVLQNGELERVGGQAVIKVDVRIISATNRNLHQEVKSGEFREDLFYRLNVFPITIPPLRKRKNDIPLLVAYYLHRYAAEQQKQLLQISKADLSRMTEYSWPGNIRELKNLIERSVITSRGSLLVLDWQGEIPPSINGFEMPVEKESIESVEKAHIQKILEQCQGKINGADGAAIRLGLHPSTLRSKLKKLGIVRNAD